MVENEKTDSNINILDHAKSLIKHSMSQEEKNFIFIGDEKSGKSNIFNLLFSNKKKEENLENYSQTCGINYNNATASFSNSKKILMNGYEIGGGLENIGLIQNIVYEKISITYLCFILLINTFC